MRLVTLSGAAAETGTCDDVHFGGVEFFNDGEWGRICAGSTDEFTAFTVDAKVVCRQLGFRFGSLYDVVGSEDISSFADTDYGPADPDRPGRLVWATDVECTGLEQRLGECVFPEEFGARPGGAGGVGGGGARGPGLRNTSCDRRDRSVFGVICRQFEIPGADPHVLPAVVYNVVCVRELGMSSMRAHAKATFSDRIHMFCRC